MFFFLYIYFSDDSGPFKTVAISTMYSIGQGFPKWTMTDTQGATCSKGIRGGP